MQNLLIVDDHQLFAEGVRFLTESSTDCRVIDILNDGRDVAPFLTRHPVDLILLDIELPGLSGYEVTKFVRAFHARRQSVDQSND